MSTSRVATFQHVAAILLCLAFLVNGASSASSGDSSPYQYNPDYVHRPLTLGDLEDDGRRQYTIPAYPNEKVVTPMSQGRDPYTYRRTMAPRPLPEVLRDFFVQLHQLSPTLFYGTVSSLAVYVLWQIPALSSTLQRHFVCSRSNWKRRRFHSSLLSAISHASPAHLLMNMYGYITFGSSVRGVTASNGLPLWPFVAGAAVAGSLAFLALSPNGGCVGLSGVTLAMLAFDAMVYPSKELGFIVRFVPIRMPAQYALIGLLALSVCGALGLVGGSRGNVAHATHLGGLVFGVVYFEALSRGWLKHWLYWRRRLHTKLRR